MKHFLKDFYGKTVSRMLWDSALPSRPGYFVGLRDQRKRPNRTDRIVHAKALMYFPTLKAAQACYNSFNTKERILEFLHSNSQEALEAAKNAAWYSAHKPSAKAKAAPQAAAPKMAPSRRVLKAKAPKLPASFLKALALGLVDAEGNFLQ